MNENRIWGKKLRGLFSIDLLIEIIFDPSIPKVIRSSFTQLLLNLYLNDDKYLEVELPQLLRISTQDKLSATQTINMPYEHISKLSILLEEYLLTIKNSINNQITNPAITSRQENALDSLLLYNCLLIFRKLEKMSIFQLGQSNVSRIMKTLMPILIYSASHFNHTQLCYENLIGRNSIKLFGRLQRVEHNLIPTSVAKKEKLSEIADHEPASWDNILFNQSRYISQKMREIAKGGRTKLKIEVEDEFSAADLEILIKITCMSIMQRLLQRRIDSCISYCIFYIML